MSGDLTQVVAELRAVVAAQSEQLERLQHRVVELEGGDARGERDAPTAHIADPRVSRRNLLGKAGAVAAAGVAGAVVGGGVLAQPAAASNGGPLTMGATEQSASAATRMYLVNYENNYGLGVNDFGGPGPKSAYIAAYSRNRASGKNMPAFRGDAESSNAFYGTATNVPALFGTCTGSAGVQGNCTGNGPAGVIGASTNTDGVWGLSTTSGSGVLGQSTSGAGVLGSSSSGVGVRGVSGPAFGVSGESTQGYGVRGQSTTGGGVLAQSTKAAALEAHGGTYGAWIQGASAALYLVPQPTGGKPTSGAHKRGELLCDKNGVLWFCQTAGSPGTWKKVTLS